MQKIVGVKFSSSNKVYTFGVNDIDLKVGDNVIVDSNQMLAFGLVATEIKTFKDEEIPSDLKFVIRKATDSDKKKYEELKNKAHEDIKLVREKVNKLNLEMKIVSCEYSFDATKIIIEFSAEDRVDFRELLKELAASLKVRIELHQVGQRDEVKIKGGIGPCGEICCCVRFLKDFEHVTVKMAKSQGLSLSPTKINGLCGRLMCCLAYENKTYEEILKKMPKVNSEINSPKGIGTVVYNDILRERVSVKVKTGEDSFTIYDFSLIELNGETPEIIEEPKKEPLLENDKEKEEPKKVDAQENIDNKEKDKQKNNFKHKNKWKLNKNFKKKESK